MKRRAKNPFPGVAKNFDQHGAMRWRVRISRRGLHVDDYLPGAYGSAEFRAAYEALISGKDAAERPARHAHGTIDWLIDQYKRTAKYLRLRPTSRKTLNYSFGRLSSDCGTKRFAGLRPENVEVLLARKAETPAAANALLKLLRRLAKLAIKIGLISVDPTIGVERYKENEDGWHTWTEAEIAQYEAHHGVKSKAVLALRLMLGTGAARQDAVRLGRQSVSDGRIRYRRVKTGGDVDLPVIPDLSEVLALVSADQMLFLGHGAGLGYTPESFGNMVGDWCAAAGLPHCSAHGLRKAGATRLANAGASEFEIMAYLGHKTPYEARIYVKKADRARLGDSGMAKVKRAKDEQNLSNAVETLDKHRRKALKGKDK